MIKDGHGSESALSRQPFAAVYAPLPGNLTVYQNLRVFGLLYGVKLLTERIEVLLRQFYLMQGSLPRVMTLFVWVAVDIVLWGFITSYLDAVTSPGFSFVPVLIGAVLLWDFLVRAMQGVTMAFFEDVWACNFLNVFATPLSISEYLTDLVFSSVVTSSVGLAVMLVLATTLFGLSFLVYSCRILVLREDVQTRGKYRAHCPLQCRNRELISINELLPLEGIRLKRTRGEIFDYSEGEVFVDEEAQSDAPPRAKKLLARAIAVSL